MLPMSLFSYCNIILTIAILTRAKNALCENDVFSNHGIIVKSEPYTKGYDSSVTAIFKFEDSLMKTKYGVGYKDVHFDSTYSGMYSVEIYSVKNKTGPSFAMDNIFQEDNFLKISYDSYWKNKDVICACGMYCNSDQYFRISYPEKKIASCLEIMDYNNRSVYDNEKPSLPVLSITWTPQSAENYLEIVYMFKHNKCFDILIQMYDQYEFEVYTSILHTDKNMTKITIQSQEFVKNKQYKITFSKKQNGYSNLVPDETMFGIYKITNKFRSSNNISDLTTNNMHTKYISNKCLNGGYRINDELSCICPPGFQGMFCERGCGPNSYGFDCSGHCSMFTKGCRGMYFCTNNYGCTCPVGLTGSFCDQNCSPNKYGADCNQNCPTKCLNNTCNQYTGDCSRGCLNGYLPPKCIEKYTARLLNPPKLISAEPDAITVEINFELSNIKDINEHIDIKYYQLLWKTSDEHSFTRSEVKLFNLNKTEETINDLKSDTTYSIGVLLSMEDGNYDRENIVFGQYKTICYNPSFDKSNINITEGFGSIYVAWNNISFGGLECNITKLVISLYHERTNITGKNNTIPVSDYRYAVHELIPGDEYSIKITSKTHYGELQPSFVYKVIPKFKDEDIEIKNVTATYSKQNETINISWKPVVNIFGQNDVTVNTPFTRYIVKYKINRIFSCSLFEIDNEWTMITVNGSTDYDILNVTPNSQYAIQVLVGSNDETTVQQPNTIYILTPASLPALEPLCDYYNITNNSVSIDWEVDYTNCSKINGLFSKYVVELKEINENKTIIKETKEKYIYLNELKPSTDYEVKVFVKNHVGYNAQHFLLFNFRTKYDMALVDDLVIYKKSMKNKMLGLRWSYSDAKNLEGFVISFNDDSSKNVKNETVVPPTACLAWPNFYCHTFYNLSFNNDYTIKVKAKSLDYPDGGRTSSVQCSTIDGIPDSPSNFKAMEIGHTTITLQWDVPWIFNGELKSFVLNFEETSSVDTRACCESFTPIEIPFGDERPIYTYTLTNLRPGSMYSIGVLSKAFWYGSPSRIQVTTLL